VTCDRGHKRCVSPRSCCAGDMHAAALACQTRGERFSGVHLSNVPDYTGICNALLAFQPLLRHPPPGGLLPWSHELGPSDRAHSYIRHEILLNPTIYQHLDDVCQRALYLPDVLAVGAALGLRYAGGQLYGEHIYWQPCEPFKSTADVATELRGSKPPIGYDPIIEEAALRTWLVRLLLTMALPPIR